ncbi:MBL fold metallo-hydrolase [Archangium primigenium]|uniref:MBL fold metallo-hydrolase n=1 Tax=[Archangium] primigenium TaxID=2792470 RepID=UPI00195E7072|nr:MBL fold metallo-hydrolase [Archangium primigenium]MBM7119109.1 MBL fold metallo-hydrolase [Archangium primigenium]
MPPRFKNLDGTGPHPLSNVFKWAVGDKLAGKRRQSPATCVMRRVEPDLAVLAVPPAPGEGARLTWLGHASWLVQLDGVSLLIDPVLGDTIPGFIRRNTPPGVPVSGLPRITASLVSHNHFDHLDLPTLRQVGAPIVGGLGLARYFQRARLPVTELDWWGSTRVGPVTVHFVPAQHWSRRGVNDANETLWGGFVVEGTSARVYHSGDTAYFEGFQEIGRRFPALDAALLPIGAYDPEWFMSRQHMNPEEAVRAFVDLGARRFLAMHWGTFKLTDEPLDEPPQRLDAEWKRRALPSEPLHVLAVGESLGVRQG